MGKRSFEVREKSESDIPWLQPGKPVLWIMAAGCLVYLQALGFGLTNWDDLPLLQSVNRLPGGLAGLVQAFQSNVFVTGSGAYYRPILTLSFMISTWFGGNELAPQFLVNIALHLTASGILYLLLVELGNSRAPSFLFSLLYVLHPALAQAVAWIPGRNDSLLGIFVFSSFLFFVRFAGRWRWTDGAWHLFFFLLAIFTKEAALSLVLICPLYLLLAGRTRLNMYRSGVLALFWAGLVGVWAVLRAQATTPLPYVKLSALLHSAWLNSPGLVQYLGKAFFPFNLSVVPIMRDTTYLWGILAVAGLAAALFYSRNLRMSRVVFGFLFFLAFILPPLLLGGSRQSVSTVLLEHRLYLPMAGLILVFLETDLAKNWVKDRKVSKAAVAMVLLLFALLGIRHSRDFADEASFWASAAENSPHAAFVHTAIAQTLDQQGKRAEAIDELRTALELNPSEFAALVNLSTLEVRIGKYEEAEALLIRALAEEPGDPELRKNLLVNLERIRTLKGRKNETEGPEPRRMP
jgi:protein O-mannosyl-transferase